MHMPFGSSKQLTSIVFDDDKAFFEDHPHRKFRVRFAIRGVEPGAIMIILKVPEGRLKFSAAPGEPWDADDLARFDNDQDGERLWRQALNMCPDKRMRRALKKKTRAALH